MAAINSFWINLIFLEELAFLKDAITRRLLPAFDTISDEAADVYRAAWESAYSHAPAHALYDLAEASMTQGGDHYVMLANTRQAFVNLFAVAIWHLVEQQCLTLLRKELRPRSKQDDPKDLTLKEFKSKLRHRGIDAEKLDGWLDIEELRVVANVVKHAEGNAAARLRALRPQMFVHPEDRDAPPDFGDAHSIDHVYRPLSGNDIYVTDGDLVRYCGAAESFWRALDRTNEFQHMTKTPELPKRVGADEVRDG
jgi:hypothetical protein